ncbi:hypothetical protein INR49_001386 [Caranx melampygus]|nr:hypothetical protein INR49_001386 [Caranx melampygus]
MMSVEEQEEDGGRGWRHPASNECWAHWTLDGPGGQSDAISLSPSSLLSVRKLSSHPRRDSERLTADLRRSVSWCEALRGGHMGHEPYIHDGYTTDGAPGGHKRTSEETTTFYKRSFCFSDLCPGPGLHGLSSGPGTEDKRSIK